MLSIKLKQNGCYNILTFGPYIFFLITLHGALDKCTCRTFKF